MIHNITSSLCVDMLPFSLCSVFAQDEVAESNKAHVHRWFVYTLHAVNERTLGNLLLYREVALKINKGYHIVMYVLYTGKGEW